MTPGDAAAALAALRLALVVGGTEPSDATAGTILEQAPDAGQRVPVGSVVTVVTAVPIVIPKVVVPDVTGMDVAVAQRTLKAAGLLTTVDDSRPSPAPVNSVIAQVPDAGTEVDQGSTVEIVPARANVVAVPDVRGRAIADAVAVLTAGGLGLTQASQQSDAP